jgi:hypothetical protein
MSNEVIHKDGEDVVVREDTAKAFRGVNWAIISILAFVVIAGIITVVLFVGGASDGEVKTPAEAGNTANR